MPTLPKDLRSKLEKAVRAARPVAAEGAASALTALGVGDAKKPAHLDAAGEALRRRLRARGRQAGDVRRGDDSQETGHLVQECAYEHWHRMLFARFLAENDLLIHPEMGVSVSMEECEELARDEGLDLWELAARFAQHMLPEVFRQGDPVLQLRLPIEIRNKLTAIVSDLPKAVFTASDSLGWTYQFWQADQKEIVNKSGNKIGAEELPAVTQLFTEDYMVDFLLDNTLGAWHAGKVLAANPALAASAKSEEELRRAVALPGCEWKYLRFVARPSRSGSLSEEPERDAPDTEEPERDALATDDALATPDFSNLRTHAGENLPHWQCAQAIYHVAFRLADSVPQSKREEWLREREIIAETAKRANRELTPEEKERIRFLYSERIEKFLDSGHGECILARPEIADLVAGAFRHFEGQRYLLHAWCVMPNHVHVIVEPLPEQDLSKIIHSWKSFTAHEINKRLGRTGDVWQHDAYNHIIRSEREYAFQLRYVAENPLKGGLKDWKWVAARPTVTRPTVARPSRSGPTDEPQTGTVWLPACTFPGWPKTAAELKCLDPCMGSGHFVVAMFERLVAMRMAEENLDEASAVAAVIRDNLFGLEIDPRCTQIAAFNLALAAWRRVGHCPLPAMHLACSGLAPNTREADWLAIAGDNEKLRNGMERLYRLFQNAPVLGSLINPRAGEGDLLVAAFHELQPLLEKALAQETKDDTAHELAVTARGLAKAAEILAGQFTLVATNVPYLKNGKQEAELQEYCELHYGNSKGNLSCVFVERCLGFCEAGSTFAGVVINEMLFLVGYRKLREHLLAGCGWQFAAKLGAGAFETITGEVVNVSLIAATRSLPNAAAKFLAIDAGDAPQPQAKADMLRMADPTLLSQKSQLLNPDARITVSEGNEKKLLSAFSDFGKGSVTGDGNHYLRMFWEVPAILPGYRGWLNSPNAGDSWSGREHVVMWELKGHDLRSEIGHMIRGDRMWGHKGVAVCKMSGMDACLYTGELFDDNIGVLLPNKQSELPAIFVFAESPDYRDAIRKIDQAIKVTAATLVKVPFDLAHWQKVAAEKYPDGLPKPFSSDPTQWLFDGGVARPSRSGPSNEPEREALATSTDRDGLATLLAAAGKKGSKSTTLEDWLRDEFFEQHCEIFHQRPFLWHLWDGRKDGFHAIVNYHRLAAPDGAGRRTLEALTHGYLGDWITRQRAAVAQGESGADDRLAAALELHGLLEKILAGEPPYDLFIRWKPLHQQPIGWEPDISDGVRLNARPFLATDLSRGKKGAGLFRAKINLKWTKDRGKEPMRAKEEYPWFWGWDEKTKDFAGGSKFDGNRWNDLHYTTAFKQAARDNHKKGTMT